MTKILVVEDQEDNRQILGFRVKDKRPARRGSERWP